MSIISKKKGVSTNIAIIVSVVVTAIIVGSAVYVFTPKEKEPTEPSDNQITQSDVESYLSEADDTTLKSLAQSYISQDILSEISKKPRKITIGWQHPYAVQGESWNLAFEAGLNRLKEQFPNVVNLVHKESVSVEDTQRVAESMIEDQGADMVMNNFEFTGLKLRELASQYPDQYFYCPITGDLETERNFIRFYPKEYHAIFLAGMVAGALTETNHIGMVGAKRVPEVARRCNVFMLGIQEVNPDAKMHIRWVDKWYDPPTESEIAKTLVDDLNCDVLCQQTDSSAPVTTAADEGVWFIGKDIDFVAHEWATGETVATSFAWRWDAWLLTVLKEVMLGRENPQNFYFGGMWSAEYIDEQMVPPADLEYNGKLGAEAISPTAEEKLSQNLIDKIDRYRRLMMVGAWDPFMKEIVASGVTDDHEPGEVISPAGEMPTPEELKLQYYFVEGIETPKA